MEMNGFYDTALMWVGQLENACNSKHEWDYGQRWVEWKGVSTKEIDYRYYIYSV